MHSCHDDLQLNLTQANAESNVRSRVGGRTGSAETCATSLSAPD